MGEKSQRSYTIGRRELLGFGLGAGVLVAAGGKVMEGNRSPKTREHGDRMPVLFVAHGAPILLDMDDWVHELKAWAAGLPRPKSILMLSAHWEQRPITVGATRTVPLLYDFYGFPERYYRQQYPAPGAPELAARVRQLLSPQPVADQPARGLDHGAYVPLVAMYPEANIPVLQVSLPSLNPVELLALGRMLTPLRDEGVLIIGSGFLTHNLRRIDFSPHPQTPAWAAEFDEWVADALRRKDVDALMDFEARGPGASIALPTTEHYVPVLTAIGAALEDTKPVRFPITGFMGGSATRRSVQFG